MNAVTDANGKTTNYVRGSIIGEIQQITYPWEANGANSSARRSVWYAYLPNDPHYLIARTDERGSARGDPNHTTTYHRDANNRVYQIDYPPDANNVVAHEYFSYNTFGQVWKHQRRNSYFEYFQYDGRGLLTAKWNPTLTNISDPSQLSSLSAAFTSYSYYTSGPWTDRVQTVTSPANASGAVASESYEYDRVSQNGIDGDYQSVAPCGGRGLVTRITHADGTYRSFAYDQFGNKLAEEDELHQGSTEYGYDSYNRLQIVTDPLNHSITYDYTETNGDPATDHTSNSPRTVTDPAEVVTTNGYDNDFRKTSTQVASNPATNFKYDAVGNVTDVTDPRGHITHAIYDSRNRKVTVTAAYNETLAQSTTYRYWDGINILQIERTDGQVEKKTYDNLNRLWTHTEPVSPGVTKTTTLDYWPSGKLYHVKDVNGHTTIFSYNEADLKTVMQYPDNSTEQWAYDNVYNLQSRTTVNNEVQTFGYDNRNRQKTMNWNNKADWASFNYDAATRMTQANNPNCNITRQYDAANRLTHDTQAIIGTSTMDVQYAYDGSPSVSTDNGRLTEVNIGGTYSSSTGNFSGGYFDRRLSYDSMGRLQYIGDEWRGNVISYSYDAASNVNQRNTIMNNAIVDYAGTNGYDALNRMPQRALTANGATLSNEQYLYKPNYPDLLQTVTRSEDGSQEQFGYDYSSQLISAATQSHSVGYAFDLAGNRTGTSDSIAGGTSYVQKPGGTAALLNQYDTVGSDSVTNNPDHQIASYQGVNYTYINDGRLTQVTSAQGGTYTLKYDALGRTVSRNLNGTITYYYYDGDRPIQETNSAGGGIATNYWGIGVDELVIRFEQGGKQYFFYQDHEGSVTHVRNQYNQLVEQYRYDSFGAPTIRDGSGNIHQDANGQPLSAINNRFMFTGREWAGAQEGVTLGFYEYRARAYHPGLGRFMSEDPKGFDAGDYNLFRYCDNDPEDRTDAMGLDDNGAAQQMRFERQANATENKFLQAIDRFLRTVRPDAAGVDAREVAKAVFNDAREAARDEARDVRTTPNGSHRGEERAFAEYTPDGKALIRSGPRTGEHDEGGRPQAHLPGPPPGVGKDAAPVTISHSHGPGSGPSLERNDQAVANGHSALGKAMISSVGATGDFGNRISIYVPDGNGAGMFFHSSDGSNFYTGR